MILTDYFRSDKDVTWDYAKQCGVTHGVIRLPETKDFDLTDKTHWQTVHKRFTDYGIKPIIVEPMPNEVHDHIKAGDHVRDESIDKVLKMLPIMRDLGMESICFNWMAHIGWFRTRSDIIERGDALVTEFNPDDFQAKTDVSISEKELWDNYEYFLKAVIPTAEKCGIKLALHPDDPPVPKLGNVSRIMVSVENIKKAIYGVYPSESLLCFVTLGSSACNIIGSNSSSTDKPSVPAEDYTVWASSTYEKFKQDDFSKAKEGDLQVNIEAVKNEYESAQLLISTSDDISSYYLEKSDLTCGENTISASNIQIYNVLYVELSSERDLANYGGGIYPDVLVPIEKAKEAGELKAAANTNVQLWITVYVPPKETSAGVYSGNFKLTVDGKEISVPVSVTVYDYTLTDDNHAPSMFTYRQDRIGVGELDNSTAMMEYYYDYFSDYRIMLQELPIESLTPSELADAVEWYYDKMTTFSLLSAKGNITTNFSRNKESIRAQILELAKRSTAEKNLVSKAAIYCMDEPNVQGEDSDNVLQTAINTMNDWYSMLNEIVATISADESGAYENFKNYSDWQNQILTIPNIIPHTIGKVLNCYRFSNHFKIKAYAPQKLDKLRDKKITIKIE